MTATRWVPAYVGLGSNLSEPVRQVTGALVELCELCDSQLVCHSRLYRSSPMGPRDQPDYINAVAALVTHLTPTDLLAALRSIEDRHGRDRSAPRWGPRTLDLDLLLVGELQISEPRLKLPHPGIHERNFVLYPLAEIAPLMIIPGQGRVRDLAARCSREGLELVENAG